MPPLLRCLAILSLVLSYALPAQAGCADDPVVLGIASDADAATREAAMTWLSGELGPGGWSVAIDGPRTIVTHGPTGQRFARSLPVESTAYDRALATIELLGAARAACTDVPAPATEEVPAPATASVSFAAQAGVRFDADIGGPWLLRPTLGIELGLLRGAAPVFVSVALEGSALGVYQRDDARQGLGIRYERHDATLAAGIGLPIEALTVFVRATGGVSIRDVTATVDGAVGGHRSDVGAVLGLSLGCRLRLVGPLGLRLAVDLSVVPTVATYRADGIALVTEQSTRLSSALLLDLEAF